MKPAVLLSLISSLYEQLVAEAERVAELEAQLADKDQS